MVKESWNYPDDKLSYEGLIKLAENESILQAVDDYFKSTRPVYPNTVPADTMPAAGEPVTDAFLQWVAYAGAEKTL